MKPPLIAIAAALVVGVGLIGAALGMAAQQPATAVGADWGKASTGLRLERQCPGGGAVYRAKDGRRRLWDGGWTDGRSALRADC